MMPSLSRGHFLLWKDRGSRGTQNQELMIVRTWGAPTKKKESGGSGGRVEGQAFGEDVVRNFA